METDWSALLKAIFGRAYFTSEPTDYPDVLSISGSGCRQKCDSYVTSRTRAYVSRHCCYDILPNNFDCKYQSSALSDAEWAWPYDVTVTSVPVENLSSCEWSTMTCWTDVPQLSSEEAVDNMIPFSVFPCDKSSTQTQSSTSVQTAKDSHAAVTARQNSSKTSMLMADTVSAVCHERLFRNNRASTVGGRQAGANERRYQCRECGDQFSASTTLRRHQLVHNGQQPWSCGYCAAKFSLKFNCSRHCRHKHPHLPPLVVPTPTD